MQPRLNKFPYRTTIPRPLCGGVRHYFAVAKSTDATLLPVDERIIEIPRGKNGMGQCQVWYADAKENQEFVKSVKEYINNYN
ncbi:hypothetical protein AGMMS49940_09670 [Spirochaetia bacterium]|nr:hypothetical protein AGMMS49940_09670 [Spirochaetia bacterium]